MADARALDQQPPGAKAKFNLVEFKVVGEAYHFRLFCHIVLILFWDKLGLNPVYGSAIL